MITYYIVTTHTYFVIYTSRMHTNRKLPILNSLETVGIHTPLKLCIISSNFKKEGKWMSLCCTVDYKWVTVMHSVKFEFNDISLYTKNDSERRRSVSLGYLDISYYIYTYRYYLLLISYYEYYYKMTKK